MLYVYILMIKYILYKCLVYYRFVRVGDWVKVVGKSIFIVFVDLWGFYLVLFW